MWWFIVTFIVGLAVGRLRWLPTALLQRPRWFVFPALFLLLVLLGYQIGGNKQVLSHLGGIGGQAIVITILSMAGSVACAMLTNRYFLRVGVYDGQSKAVTESKREEEQT